MSRCLLAPCPGASWRLFHPRHTIRGHVSCSFLALIVRRQLQDRIDRTGCGHIEWADIMHGLRAIAEFDLTVSGKTFTVRSNAAGAAAKAITAAGVALPPAVPHR